MSDIVVIAHNIRSTHNVGSIFRTCEGFGVTQLILSGYTPYPPVPEDTRLPHIIRKLASQIHKTALGAETMVPFTYSDSPPLADLKNAGYRLVALEQDARSIPLHTYHASGKIALLLGEEVAGVAPELLSACDVIVEIPMAGNKESFNVSVSAGIALFQLSLRSA